MATPWWKYAHLDDAFLEVFLPASKPSRRSITAAKRKENEEKEMENRMKRIKKPEDVGHKILISGHTRAKMLQIKTRTHWQEKQAVML